MKIVFLDIDGVLNSTAWFAQGGNPFDTRTPKWDPATCSNLLEILTETDADVVISSSWRVLGLEMLKEFFWQHGLPPERIVGETPQMWGNSCRGHEIASWAEENGLLSSEFVILDDRDDMEPFMERLVQTDEKVGLTRENAEAAIRLLGVTP